MANVDDDDDVSVDTSGGESSGGATSVVDERTRADDALVATVRQIEDQPLAERAAAFATLHDELRARLGDAGAAGV